MLWYFYSDQLQFFILVVNFFAFFCLFVFAIYLYRVEKRIKDQTSKLESDAESIVEDANHKALEIITKSQYLTDSMKQEVNSNFQKILEDLKLENRKFYHDLEDKYVATSKNFVDKISQEEESEISKLTKGMIQKAEETEAKIESTLEKDFQEAHTHIEEFEQQKKEAFEAEMRQRIAKIAKELLPQYIKPEDQEKIAQAAVEKAYEQGFFNA